MSRTAAIRAQSPSRIRLVVFEAELTNGNVTEVTQVIQNALRANVQPPTPRAIAQRMVSSQIVDQEPTPMEDFTDENTEATVEPASAATQSRAVGPRKVRTPKVLDVDLASELSFSSFAQSKNPPSDQMRYLTVATWFKEHRGIDAITADHVYTCYRAVNWPTTITDFGAPLRSLKRDQFFEQTGKGLYAINHLGLAKVLKLGS